MLDQQAARLLATGDARSQSAVMGFMNGWLGLDRLYTTAKDGTVYTLTDALRADMATETQSLLLEAFNGTGSFGSVLTADHSFLNRNLATFYGLPTDGLGTASRASRYTASTGAIRACSRHASHPDRLLAARHLLAHPARAHGPLPDAVPGRPAAAADLDTTFQPSAAARRRASTSRRARPGRLRTCHQYMDPIGFGFENYDGFGRYRTTENGMPSTTA